MSENQEYKYQVVGIRSMYDGDSVNVTVVRTCVVEAKIMDFGFGDIVTIPEHVITKNIEVNIRMRGYDTPELRDKRPDWKKAAYLARDKARAWMQECLDEGVLLMETHKDSTGKFGRYLAEFYDMENEDETDNTLGKYLIGERLAVPYHGQNKSEIEALHQANINILKEKGEI